MGRMAGKNRGAPPKPTRPKKSFQNPPLEIINQTEQLVDK
jgi:hypothetical protein